MINAEVIGGGGVALGLGLGLPKSFSLTLHFFACVFSKQVG